MGSISLYKVEKGRSEEEFLRDALVETARLYQVPAEFFDCEFSDVKLEYKSFLTMEAEIDIRYQVMLGYFKWGNESRGKTALESYKWKPYSNTIRGKKSKITLKMDNDSANDIYNKNVADWVVGKDKTLLSEEEQVGIRLPSKQEIDRHIVEQVEECMDVERKNLPGDNYRDLTYDYECSYRIVGYTIPQYSTTCKLNDKKYEMRDFAPGGFVINKVPNIKDKVFAKGAIKDNKKASIPYLVGLFLLTVLSIVGIYISEKTIPSIATIFLLVLSGVGLIIFCGIYFKIFNESFRDVCLNKIKENQELKIDKLQKCLSRYNLEELSASEKQKILDCEVSGKNKTLTLFSVLFGLICAFACIAIVIEALWLFQLV